MIVHEIQPAEDGWFVRFEVGGVTAYAHLTPEWCDEMYIHQIKPQICKLCPNPDTSFAVAWNRLHHAVCNGGSTEKIAELFAEAYGQIVGQRAARQALGLKAVTKHGYEDLQAVQAGAPVRPWNAKKSKKALHDWIRNEGRRQVHAEKS